MRIITQGRCRAHQRIEPPSALLWEEQEEEENQVDTSVFPVLGCQAQQTGQHSVWFCLLGQDQDPRVGWAKLQALCRWRLSAPESSQSSRLYSVAYLLPTPVAFSQNKQLFYGLPSTEAN